MKGSVNVPKIIPIRELKNTATISKFVEESNEPVFITKNGYGSMVMMSMEVYEREFARNQMIELINDSINEYKLSGESINGAMFINELKSKYGK